MKAPETMLLGGRAMRRLYSLAVRPYSVAVEASGAATAEGAASTVDRETDGDTSDVTTRNLSFKDMNRSRTRAKVEAQMWGFLRSREYPYWHGMFVVGVVFMHMVNVSLRCRPS